GLEAGVDRAVADDQPGRPGSHAPPVDGLVGGGSDLGVGGQTEVVVGGEGDDRPIAHGEVRPAPVEGPQLPPAPGRPDLLGLLIDPPVPTRHAPKSARASSRTSTMRSISTSVLVRMGIRTTTSPSERRSTPRSTAAAHTR